MVLLQAYEKKNIENSDFTRIDLKDQVYRVSNRKEGNEFWFEEFGSFEKSSFQNIGILLYLEDWS